MDFETFKEKLAKDVDEILDSREPAVIHRWRVAH